MPDTVAYRERFKIEQEIILSEDHLRKIELFRDWMRSSRYSDNTIKTYLEGLYVFFKYFHKNRLMKLIIMILFVSTMIIF